MRVYPKWKLGAPSLYISPLTLAVSKLRLRLHGVAHNTPSPMALFGGEVVGVGGFFVQRDRVYSKNWWFYSSILLAMVWIRAW